MSLVCKISEYSPDGLYTSTTKNDILKEKGKKKGIGSDSPQEGEHGKKVNAPFSRFE